MLLDASLIIQSTKTPKAASRNLLRSCQIKDVGYC
jgi:hypothetical protein